MTIESVTPILNVKSVPESLAWFEALGWERTFTWNAGGNIEESADRNDAGEADFAGLCTGKEGQLFLCRDGQGHRIPRAPAGAAASHDAGSHEAGGVWMSWWMTDEEALRTMHKKCLELGLSVPAEPRVEPWGVIEFHLHHPDGHTFRVGCGGS